MRVKVLNNTLIGEGLLLEGETMDMEPKLAIALEHSGIVQRDKGFEAATNKRSNGRTTCRLNHRSDVSPQRNQPRSR